MGGSAEDYTKALTGRKIPILTLDNKWHQIFTRLDSNGRLRRLEEEVNELLKEQGRLTTESKEIRKIKKKLMDEIVTFADELNENGDNEELSHKIDENKRVINECNEKMDAYQDRLLELPAEIDHKNSALMLETMDICYHSIQKNSKDIAEIAKWITQVRIELKKNLIRKQEREALNQELYSYMHDIFGADVIEIFDMKYNVGDLNPKPESK